MRTTNNFDLKDEKEVKTYIAEEEASKTTNLSEEDLFGEETSEDLFAQSEDLFFSEEKESVDGNLFDDFEAANFSGLYNDGEFLSPYTEDELAKNQLHLRELNNDLFFAHKGTVSDYETLTKVEYKINSWEELSTSMDLSWVDRSKKDYTCIQTKEQFEDALRHMKAAKYIACDTETTGLNIYDLKRGNPLKDEIVGCSFSWKPNQGIYIPFRHKKFNNMPLSKCLKKLKPILETKQLILHNALFDYRVYYDLGINIHVAHDSMSLLFHINSMVAKGGKALKENIKKIFGIDTLDLETMTGSNRYAAKFDTLDFRTCEVYGCADTDFALMLFLHLLPMLDKRSYAGYLQDMKMIPVLSKMEYYGRKVDTERLPEFNSINNSDIRILKDLAQKYIGTYINMKNGVDEIGTYLLNFSSPDELSTVIYDILAMPVLSRSEKTGKPQTNSLAFKTFLSEAATGPDPVLEKLISKDVLSGYAELGERTGHDYHDDKYLIKYSKISETKYPFIYILKELRARIKLKTAFFAKLMNDSYEGKYFTSVSLTAAETHRIIDPAQTIPAFLKELFIPFNDDQYLLDSDYAQMEARVFSSLAGMQNLVDRLTIPWTDYHRESGSAIFGKRPEDISKEERGNLKVVNFGLPFKMGPKGLVGFKYGLVADKEKEQKYILEMEELVRRWEIANKPVLDMLNWFRAKAVTICKEEKVLKYFGNRKIGKIYNHAGRARVFDLEGVVDDEGNIIDKSKAEAIYRQAGNFPIQGYAAHVYREGVLSLMDLFRRDHLIDIEVEDPESPTGVRFDNKIYMTATVHDESLFIIDKHINPYYIIEGIAEYCMVRKKGHAPYYMGISFAYDWHEGHSGSTEMPVGYVFEVVKEQKELAKKHGLDRVPIYRDTFRNPRDILVEGIEDYNKREIVKEFVALNKGILETGVIDAENMAKNFSNYTLKATVFDFKKFAKKEIVERLEEEFPSVPEKKELVTIIGVMSSLFIEAQKKEGKLVPKLEVEGFGSRFTLIQ